MASRERERDRAAQAKSRAERSRPPAQPAPHVEIVPGRLSEPEWLWLLAAEEAEEAVGDVLAAVLSQALAECRELDLARQRIPYVINQAREAMLQIIEWRFLVRDEGEVDVSVDHTWQEDEEPMACITDSWAQGAVPVLQAVPSPKEGEVPLAELPEAAAVPQEMLFEVGSAPPSVEELSWQPSQEEAMLVQELPAPRVESPSPVPASTSVKSKKGGPAFRGAVCTTWLPGSGELLDESEKQLLLGKLCQVPVEERSRSVLYGRSMLLPPSCSNLLRIQLGRPPNIKDVLYDNSGNITVVPRLDPARLPKGWVKPSVEVVDPDVESRRQEALKTVSGRCKHRRRSKPPWGGADAMVPSGSQPHGVHWAVQGSGPAGKRLPEQVAPPPPPGQALEPTSLIFVKPTLLMETVQLAPGVTIRGGGGTRRGMHPAAPPEESESVHEKLKPVSSQIPFLPPVAVEKVTQEPRALPRMPPSCCSRALTEAFQG